MGISPDEKISNEEAVAGMTINGLGLLFRSGVIADDFNRFKLGHTLERISEFGSKIDVVKNRLIKNYSYCNICATDALHFVASIFARGDVKKSMN